MGERRSDSATAAAATRRVSRGPVQPGCALEVHWSWTPSRRPRYLAWSRAKCIGVPGRDCVSGNRCSCRAGHLRSSDRIRQLIECFAALPVRSWTGEIAAALERLALLSDPGVDLQVDGTSAAEINPSAWSLTLLRGGPPSARLVFRMPVGAVPGLGCSCVRHRRMLHPLEAGMEGPVGAGHVFADEVAVEPFGEADGPRSYAEIRGEAVPCGRVREAVLGGAERRHACGQVVGPAFLLRLRLPVSPPTTSYGSSGADQDGVVAGSGRSLARAPGSAGQPSTGPLV